MYGKSWQFGTIGVGGVKMIAIIGLYMMYLIRCDATFVTTRCLAVTGGGSVGTCCRLSQVFSGHYNTVILHHLTENVSLYIVGGPVIRPDLDLRLAYPRPRRRPRPRLRCPRPRPRPRLKTYKTNTGSP